MHSREVDQDNLAQEYTSNGYAIAKVIDNNRLSLIQSTLLGIVKELLGSKIPKNYEENILDNVHLFINIHDLNDFRLKVIKKINSDPQFRVNYYLIAKPFLDVIVSNEISMQLNVNLSIQFPGDSSSLLPIHADTWSGDSPFEVVVWLPLVNCHGTKSMYIVPKDKYLATLKIIENMPVNDSEHLYQLYEADAKFLNINLGELLVFNQALPHGNRINKENETRWSMNCRFKGVFTPYGDKKNGEFFEPISLKPASMDGLSYKLPKIK
ncbi:hypothetical protein LZG75_03475 [Polynucleobacter sp. IMCC30063]|uniref:sporadic carbohydrate cluster 2OG-Fe(II) oxygenase n=1 Tax=Polynucleobacter sp. IMCC30063 TaxID=2907298 RepID=UPI001F2BF483|nr:sporadic carbohydrate cluster 2OG-Fe(II) oxygenase [Polynucleobacter sp. IMCC30063]MCE7505291.1 hypothetical protein [Polynucleobacter sp. IMCC30063]